MLLIVFTIFISKINKKGYEMEKVVKSVKVDPELWHRAKVRALSEKMTVQQLIVKLLTEYLGEGKKKGGR